jgi:hypothetical protein
MDQKTQELIDAAKDVLMGHDQEGCDPSLTVCNSVDIKRLREAVFDLTGENTGNEIESEDPDVD